MRTPSSVPCIKATRLIAPDGNRKTSASPPDSTQGVAETKPSRIEGTTHFSMKGVTIIFVFRLKVQVSGESREKDK